jgi:DNA polymerase-3 subunit alpha
MYKLNKICGTCISKDKAKGTVTLLTTTGVVNVKFRKEYFTMYDKQISRVEPDGTKKVVEKSFFNKGNMIVVMGIRSGDDFIVKKYASSSGEQLYHIDKVNKDGTITLRHERASGDEEDE